MFNVFSSESILNMVSFNSSSRICALEKLSTDGGQQVQWLIFSKV